MASTAEFSFFFAISLYYVSVYKTEKSKQSFFVFLKYCAIVILYNFIVFFPWIPGKIGELVGGSFHDSVSPVVFGICLI